MTTQLTDGQEHQNQKTTVGLLIVDLDNTLWDWAAVWTASFTAMLEEVVGATGLDIAQLKKEIREVHQARGTTEYSFLLREVPSLKKYFSGTTAEKRFDRALHAQNSKRFHLTRLYPEVMSTLMRIRSGGVKIIAYTESVAYWAEWRIRRTGLDGVIDFLYSAPDHDFPAGLTPNKVRTRSENEYGLKKTVHLHVAKGLKKPNPEILSQIVLEHGIQGLNTVYVGDSLSRDVAMAQMAGVIDVYASYGHPQRNPNYSLLEEVSHWTDEEIENEARTSHSMLISPTVTLSSSFGELLEYFDFRVKRDVGPLIEAWKQTVAVQQHFNDISWRIRSLAMTALTFILSATYVVFTKLDKQEFDVGKSASIVCFLGLVVWLGFWFMDAAWYHRLLRGSVAEGERLERRLTGLGVDVELGRMITHASHDSTPTSALARRAWYRTLIPRRASGKLHLFYGLISLVLLLTGILLILIDFR